MLRRDEVEETSKEREENRRTESSMDPRMKRIKKVLEMLRKGKKKKLEDEEDKKPYDYDKDMDDREELFSDARQDEEDAGEDMKYDRDEDAVEDMEMAGRDEDEMDDEDEDDKKLFGKKGMSIIIAMGGPKK